MRLTILGKSPAWSDSGGACSGYLVEEGGTVILLDCGNGVFGKLRERADHWSVDAVVISHLHGDHVLDLVPFAYSLTLPPEAEIGRPHPGLLAPKGASEFFRRLTGAWGDEDLIPEAFRVREYQPGDDLRVRGILINPHSVPHTGPTNALELTAASGARMVFGADGRYSEELIAAARGADLLLAEATHPDNPPPGDVHMSAEEAGRLAREAAVGRLVLTHISDDLDLGRSQRIAAEAFGGEVDVAEEFAVFEI